VAGVLLALVLAQTPACSVEAVALMQEASARMESFDAPGAVERLRRAAATGCQDADVAAWYLAGLTAAREAYRTGGDPRSLAPVVAAQKALDRHITSGSAQAQIAHVVLMAAAAAAMSERNDVGVFLDHAIQVESEQLIAGRPGAPFVTAHEIAGDLWLQVHRFDSARTAYRAASSAIGLTPRVTLGIARAAVRLEDSAAACSAYGRLLSWWGERARTKAAGTDGGPLPSEVEEARAHVVTRACAP
jgi:hypothetical protein